VAVAGKLVQKKERDRCIQKEKQYTKQHKKAQSTQNRKQIYKTRKNT
jgi:hypothetical protein